MKKKIASSSGLVSIVKWGWVGVIVILGQFFLTAMPDSMNYLVRSANAQVSIFFEENFDALDPARWEVNQNGYPVPVSVSLGFIHMGAPGTASLDFPYVRSMVNPFPATGDFQLEVGFQYTGLGPLGSLFVVLGKENQSSGPFFTQDSGATGSLTISGVSTGGLDTNYHVVKWEVRGTTVTYFLDGVVRGGGGLAARPTSLWFGHPTLGQVIATPGGRVEIDPLTGIVLGRWWGYNVWTTFKLDFIRVSLLPSPPAAIAGTSLDGNNMLQLDGSLSSDPNNDPLTFSWQIEGEATPRLGRIASIADLAVGNYKVTLTVSDGVNSSTDTMPFGVPARAGVVVPTTNSLQEATLWIKNLITGFPGTSFDAPTPQARENRRKALCNMLDRVFTSIGIGDYQAAIIQLRDILDKTDGLGPPNSAPDWIIGIDAQTTANAVSHLIADLLWICPECR